MSVLKVALVMSVVLVGRESFAQVTPPAAPDAPRAPEAVEPGAPEAVEPGAPEAPTGSMAASSPPSPPDPDPEVPVAIPAVPRIQAHGFVSQGGLLTTSNDYLGHSSRGSLELFEAAVNFTTEATDRLRIGVQLFTRDIGPIGDYKITVDWAYLDYQWERWLGLRAGRIKMPFGLYNEYSDIDSARVPILLPQGVYPIASRDFLLAQTGFSVYGSPQLGGLGELDYQLFLGTIFIDPAGSDTGAIEIEALTTKYVAGAQLFWHPPVEGLRLGGTLLHMALEFDVQLDPATTAGLVMSGAVPADFDGGFSYEIAPAILWVASAEYIFEQWLFAAEYSRWITHSQSTLPVLYPDTDADSERFYGMLGYRASERLELGTYYSVKFEDVNDRRGEGPAFASSHEAFQKDLAVSLRFDVNDSWLWKLEGHYVHGTSDLDADDNPDPDRRWGLFLLKTTVTF